MSNGTSLDTEIQFPLLLTVKKTHMPDWNSEDAIYGWEIRFDESEYAFTDARWKRVLEANVAHPDPSCFVIRKV